MTKLEREDLVVALAAELRKEASQQGAGSLLWNGHGYGPDTAGKAAASPLNTVIRRVVHAKVATRD